MFSGRNWRGNLRLSLRITGWFLLIFVVAVLGLYVVASKLVQGALQEEWELTHSEVTGTVTHEGGVEVREIATRAVPPPEVQAAVEREFRVLFLVLVVPIVVIGLLGGLGLTYRAAHQARQVVRSVQNILQTGDVHRRVPLGGLRGVTLDVAELFNKALARNETLVTGLHESLDATAHDLRTPLTRLRAMAEQALTSDGDEPALREALSDCMEESDDVLSMLHTLMDLAEAGTGAMLLDLHDVSVANVVNSVADLYELVAEEKDVTLKVQIPADLEMRVDPGRARQLIANLVDNAIKYGERGGTVRIAARSEGPRVAISVADTGRGIGPEDIPRIWDRLYRSDQSRDERGLGLGLSFVKAIVEAHGGTADVVSEIGRGSVFTVRLPRSPSE